MRPGAYVHTHKIINVHDTMFTHRRFQISGGYAGTRAWTPIFYMNNTTFACNRNRTSAWKHCNISEVGSRFEDPFLGYVVNETISSVRAIQTC